MAATYVPAVYRTSGGDQLQVASGGAIVIDSGATLYVNGTLSQAGAVAFTSALTGYSASFSSDLGAQTIASSSGILGAGPSSFSTGVKVSGTLNLAGGVKQYVVANTTASTANLPGKGLCIVHPNTSAGVVYSTYYLPISTAGTECWVAHAVVIAGTSASPAVSCTSAANVSFIPGGYTVAYLTTTVNAASYIHVMAVTSCEWLILDYSTGDVFFA